MLGHVSRDGRRAGFRGASGVFAGAVAAVVVATVAATAQERGPKSVAPVAEELIEAVVNISTSQSIRGPEGLPLPKVPKDSPYDEYFGDFFQNRDRSPPDRLVSSLGSGFIIDGKQGIIVTNNHVIGDAERVEVSVGGRRVSARPRGVELSAAVAALELERPRGHVTPLSFAAAQPPLATPVAAAATSERSDRSSRSSGRSTEASRSRADIGAGAGS